MDATKLVLILMIFTIGTGLARTTFSFPKIARKVSNVDIGSPVDWSKFADSVLIQITRAPDHPLGNAICTGVLIHRRAILTSAHCADGAKSMTVIFDPENGVLAQSKAWVEHDKMLIHPEYNREKSLYENDIAILFLDHPAKKSIRIRPIPSSASINERSQLIRVGVGIRNGINMRNITDPLFVALKSPGVLEVEDSYAMEGDSGGPIYSAQQELLAIHSTMDRMDGVTKPHAYSAYLPHFKPWIEQCLKRIR